MTRSFLFATLLSIGTSCSATANTTDIASDATTALAMRKSPDTTRAAHGYAMAGPDATRRWAETRKSIIGNGTMLNNNQHVRKRKSIPHPR
jgi:hypothetical protein